MIVDIGLTASSR